MTNDKTLILVGELRLRNAPGALRKEWMRKTLEDRSVSFSEAWLSRTVSDMERENTLTKVSAGLWINRLRTPPARLEEAAAHLRKDAVVGLRSVLGESGVLNNISEEITACIPFSSDRIPARLGRVETSGGQSFIFRGLPERFFPHDEKTRELFLDKTKPYPCFSPEKSIVDWAYLADSPRSNLPRLPFDIDFSSLDLDKVNECFQAVGMKENFTSAAHLKNFLLRKNENKTKNDGFAAILAERQQKALLETAGKASPAPKLRAD